MNLEGLEREAITLSTWSWISGMITRGGAHVVDIRPDGRPVLYDSRTCDRWVGSEYALPSFTHAATRGCLLDLVRRLWNDPDAYVRTRTIAGRTIYDVHALQTNGARDERGPIMDAAGDTHPAANEPAALFVALKYAPDK